MLYNNANRLAQQLRSDLHKLEENLKDAPASLIGEITTTMNSLGRTLKDYEEYIDKQTLSLNKSQKKKNETRLINLRKEYDEYKKKFDALRKERESVQAKNNKDKLFSNTSTAISDNPYDESSVSRVNAGADSGDVNGSSNAAGNSGFGMRKALYKEQNVLERSNQQLDDILEMGRNAFDDLVEQNEVISKMRNGMNSSLETMGVSRATIRRIDQKAFEDKWIFYIGGAFTLFTMYLIWHYLR